MIFIPRLVDDSNWEPDGVTHQVRFCEGPVTNWRMVEMLWHCRETRQQQRKQTSTCNAGRTRPTHHILTVLEDRQQLNRLNRTTFYFFTALNCDNQVISNTRFKSSCSTKGESCRCSPLETPSALCPPQEAGFTLDQYRHTQSDDRR